MLQQQQQQLQNQNMRLQLRIKNHRLNLHSLSHNLNNKLSLSLNLNLNLKVMLQNHHLNPNKITKENRISAEWHKIDNRTVAAGTVTAIAKVKAITKIHLQLLQIQQLTIKLILITFMNTGTEYRNNRVTANVKNKDWSKYKDTCNNKNKVQDRDKGKG